MIDTVVKMTCNFCGQETEAPRHRVDFNGKRVRMSEKILRKKAEDWGWLKSINGDGSIDDFCGEKCYNHYKEEQSKP